MKRFTTPALALLAALALASCSAPAEAPAPAPSSASEELLDRAADPASAPRPPELVEYLGEVVEDAGGDPALERVTGQNMTSFGSLEVKTDLVPADRDGEDAYAVCLMAWAYALDMSSEYGAEIPDDVRLLGVGNEPVTQCPTLDESLAD